MQAKRVEQVSHSVEHMINWSHFALGLGLVATAWMLASVFAVEENNQTGEMRREVREARS
jgi:hypothetical protein